MSETTSERRSHKGSGLDFEGVQAAHRAMLRGTHLDTGMEGESYFPSLDQPDVTQEDVDEMAYMLYRNLIKGREGEGPFKVDRDE